MRVVFLGTPELAVPTLAVLAARHEIAGVVCQPDKPQGRSGRPAPPPVKVWAVEHGLPVHQPTRLNDGAFETWLREANPDIGVLAAYGRFLREPILAVPRHGWLNLHPSLLPRWRGPSPIQAALREGDAETGVTIMRISMKMDAGDILLQEKTPIGPEENAEELAARLAGLGADLMLRGLDLVTRGEARFTPQEDARATYSHIIEKSDGNIRWADPAPRLNNLVRAMCPWPSAQTRFRGQVCRILRSAVVPAATDGPPGTVIHSDKQSVHVATGAGALSLLEFQAPGKRAMAIAEYLRGNRIAPGDRFEDVN